jgi:plasmid stabilization system protein ParE
MNLAISWSDEAIETFDAIVLFIEKKWSERQAKIFIKQTQKIFSLISDYPYMYKASISSNVRQAFITKQTSVYYEIHKTHITILFFWDNRQEPIL